MRSIKAFEAVEVWRRPFLTLGLDGDEWFASRLGRQPEDGEPPTHWVEG